MNRAAFYDSLRERRNTLFGTSLSSRQVEGTEALLDAMEGWPIEYAAHVLAECHHETGGGMFPVKETVFAHSKNKNPTDARVKARLWTAYNSGKLPWVRTPYWKDGWFGRGQIQLTHRYNYQKATDELGVDFITNPHLALSPKFSAMIAARGCREGWFTGKKLSDFESANGFDHYEARAIVNGDKRAVGNTIKRSASLFRIALLAGGWGAPKPRTMQPVAKTNGGFFANLFKAIFGGKK